MPLLESEAIVLRTFRLGETDKIVSLLTRQFGRLRVVAAGAERPKSRFGASLEPLSYIRLWFYERENRDLLRLNSTELIESFFDMQKDYRFNLAAQFVAEVSERFLPEREVNERVFRLILKTLRGILRSKQIERPLLYFDYWLLRLGGFLPHLNQCSTCGRALGESPGYFGPGSEGLVCADCRTPNTQQAAAASTLVRVEQHCKSPLDEWLAGGPEPAGDRDVRLFFEELIESHLQKKLVTRPLLAQEA